MKNSICVKGLLWQLLIISLFANIQIASGQEEKDQSPPIPENINKIFRASCITCHNTGGKILARTKLNFSTWAEYGSVKGAEKASAICSELTKEAMPPKSRRKSNPELIPTKEQVEMICKWTESLKLKEEGNPGKL